MVEKKEPVLVRETVSRSTSDFLKEAMFQTVEVGTGKAAQVAGYDVGGKTGTAEKQPRSAKNYLVSFAGFAPIEDPQVFVYVVIDTPNYPPGEEQAHSSYASTVFSKIMTETLPYLNIFPTNDLDEDGSIQENLPSSEGINEVSTEESGEGQGELVEETEKQYETDEYVPDDGGAGSGVPDAVPKDPSGSEEPPMDTGRTQPVRTSAPSSQGQDDRGGQHAARDSTAAGTKKHSKWYRPYRKIHKNKTGPNILLTMMDAGDNHESKPYKAQKEYSRPCTAPHCHCHGESLRAACLSYDIPFRTLQRNGRGPAPEGAYNQGGQGPYH